jgi:septal ring factor EnvC (AmiA/AmiB activator)
MNNQPKIPNPERRARSVAKMREVCAMFDEQIAVLDQLIAQTEAENKKNPFNIYCQKRKQQRLEAQRQEQSQVLRLQSD